MRIENLKFWIINIQIILLYIYIDMQFNNWKINIEISILFGGIQFSNTTWNEVLDIQKLIMYNCLYGIIEKNPY